MKGWQKRPRESLEEALRWAAEGNIGLRTGRTSGVVAVDADPGADIEALGLPTTVRATSGRSARQAAIERAERELREAGV